MLARSLLLTVQALLLLSVAKAFLPSVSVVHGGGRIAAVSRWDHFQVRSHDTIGKSTRVSAVPSVCPASFTEEHQRSCTGCRLS